MAFSSICAAIVAALLCSAVPAAATKYKFLPSHTCGSHTKMDVSARPAPARAIESAAPAQQQLLQLIIDDGTQSSLHARPCKCVSVPATVLGYPVGRDVCSLSVSLHLQLACACVLLSLSLSPSVCAAAQGSSEDQTPRIPPLR